MSRLEIIHLRSSGEVLDALGRRIRESLGTENAVVTLFRREGLETDVAVHIRHLEAPERSGPSRLGLQVASSLRAFGLVEHTLWREMS